jgi:hypothetical protein
MPRSRLLLILLLLAALPALASDLTVGWISRSPDIDYVWNSSNPRVEGWPAEGSTVTWRANVRSWFDQPQNVAYVWRLDGRELARGTATIAPNAITAIDLPRAWTFARHRLSIELDSDHGLAEESETNDSLEIYTDALSVGIWVERGFYDWFRAHQNDLGIGSTSFENWAQRIIELYNDMAAMAIYEETPEGVLDRWRLQKIVVVPDGALPLVPPPGLGVKAGEPNGSTHPDMSDRSVDLQIGFQSVNLFDYQNTREASVFNPFHIAPVFIHELGHARYLTDVYAFSVGHQPPGRTIEVAGVPQLSDVYRTPEQGLMNRDYTFIDRYSAVALNRIAGARATVGNYNDPENVGSFLNDLPSQNRLTIRDADGNLLRNAKVDIYQPIPLEANSWYAARWDDHADLHLQTDANGQVLVGRSPFSPDGHVMNYWRGSTTTVIVRVEKDGVVRFGYLESRLFNLAYWRGNTLFADHELVVGAPYCANRGPVLASPAFDSGVAGPLVSVTWQPVEGATSYRVYTAMPGVKPHLQGTTMATEMTVPMAGRTYWWVEAEFAQCAPMRSDLGRLNVQTRVKHRAAR